MPYTLGDRINESATTSVYAAFDEALHRRVLLKVLHRHLAHDPQVRERFIREARACAALRSEYIVQVFELSEHDGAPAIVMEFVDGKSLKDVIADGSQRTFDFAQKVAVHVLRGLSVAHAHGIVHRDIKPGNILVSEQGTVKLTDFGLAQFALSPTITAEGSVVGTPAYIPPEIIRGQAADERTDLFSLGATLVEVLTGERLFEGATYSECLQRISKFKPEMLDRYAALSSPGFVDFLKRLMDPDPAKRPASAREALNMLGKAGSSVFAAAGNRAHRASRRIMTGVWIASAVVVIAVGVYAITHRSASTQDPTRSSPSMGLAAPKDSGSSRDENAPARKDASVPPAGKQASARAIAPPPTATPAVPDSGELLMTSVPWAKVTVDDRSIGELPLPGPLRISSGTHTVVFTHPMFEPIVRTVTVSRGEQAAVHADFLESAGFLQCTVSPWAEVFVDDLYKDTTPLSKPILLSAGTHRVRLHHSAFPDMLREVTITAHDTASLNVTFTK